MATTVVRAESPSDKEGFGGDKKSCFIKDSKGDIPDSRSLPRNDLPAPRWIKRRTLGVQRTLYTLTRGWKLGKREIWLGAETEHFSPLDTENPE